MCSKFGQPPFQRKPTGQGPVLFILKHTNSFALSNVNSMSVPVTESSRKETSHVFRMKATRFSGEAHRSETGVVHLQRFEVNMSCAVDAETTQLSSHENVLPERYRHRRPRVMTTKQNTPNRSKKTSSISMTYVKKNEERSRVRHRCVRHDGVV